MATTWRVGIDAGGTFTDLVALASDGATRRVKVPSTPRSPEDAALAALGALLGEIEADAIAFVGHASTIGTNALLGQVHLELPRVAFVTTEGFRDVLEIGRQNRSAVYDLGVGRPRPLAARADRIVVRERIAFDGSVLVALDAAAIDGAIAAVRASGAPAVAVGFLNSCRNDAHERALADALAREMPGIAVSASADLVREEREYERFSTAVVNAALAPVAGAYLRRLARGIAALGIGARVFAMQSSGGTLALEIAAERPAALIESGPAAGVIAAAALGRRLGAPDVLSFDMGGTTAKAGTIVDGAPEIAHEFEAAGTTHSGRAVRGSGYPVRFPFVDLAEVSAGGGTIATLDAAGVLRVGPLSAGADPGPACYGRGERPTVTDANVVLGRLNPAALLGGSFAIDAARARAAVASVAAPFGGDPVRAAAGILALVEAQMAKALRIVTIERGLDPRGFVLMAFGGGGPLHACALARELEIARVIVPALPGLFSAEGLVVAPTTVTRSQSFSAALDAEGWRAACALASDLERECSDGLREQGIEPASIVHEVDVRYAGQSFDLVLRFDPAHDDVPAIAARFHARHERRYGYAARDEAIDLAAVRVTAASASPELRDAPVSTPPAHAAETAQRSKREVWDGARFVAAAVFARESLTPGERIAGPAIVEHYDATTYIAPHWVATLDPGGAIVLDHA